MYRPRAARIGCQPAKAAVQRSYSVIQHTFKQEPAPDTLLVLIRVPCRATVAHEAHTTMLYSTASHGCRRAGRNGLEVQLSYTVC